MGGWKIEPQVIIYTSPAFATIQMWVSGSSWQSIHIIALDNLSIPSPDTKFNPRQWDGAKRKEKHNRWDTLEALPINLALWDSTEFPKRRQTSPQLSKLLSQNLIKIQYQRQETDMRRLFLVLPPFIVLQRVTIKW